MSRGHFDSAIGIVTVPIYFLGGVIVSAYLIDHRLYERRQPLYSTVMSLVAVCLLAAAAGGALGWFSTFDGTLQLKRDYLLLALLCMASGLQNAAITTATGASVRTTHLTGITTDLGLGLVRMFERNVTASERHRERLENKLRIGKIISFALGSIASALIFSRIQFLGFLLPAAIAIYMAIVAYLEKPIDRTTDRDLEHSFND